MTKPRLLSFGAINGLLWRAGDALPRNEFLVTGALLSFCEVDEATPADAVLECAPDAPALAERSRLSRGTALDAVDVLEEWRIVFRAGLVGHRRRYRIDLGALVRWVEGPSNPRTVTRHNRPMPGRLTVQSPDGSAAQPSNPRTVTVQSPDGNRPIPGRLASLDARAHCPSSDPSLALSARDAGTGTRAWARTCTHEAIAEAGARSVTSSPSLDVEGLFWQAFGRRPQGGELALLAALAARPRPWVEAAFAEVPVAGARHLGFVRTLVDGWARAGLDQGRAPTDDERRAASGRGTATQTGTRQGVEPGAPPPGPTGLGAAALRNRELIERQMRERGATGPEGQADA